MEFQGTVEIDRLLAERPGLHGIEYLVRWKNYNHYGDTWEPHEHYRVSSEDGGAAARGDGRRHGGVARARGRGDEAQGQPTHCAWHDGHIGVSAYCGRTF